MTYPITPNPAIHNQSPQAIQKQQLQTAQALETMGKQLLDAIVNAVLSIISGGVLGKSAGTPSSDAGGLLGNIFTNFFSALGIGDPTSTLSGSTTSFDPVTVVENFVQNLIQPLGLLLDGGSPLNAQNLFGSISSELLSILPIGQLGNAPVELMVNSGFDGSVSMSALGHWTWDATTGHTSNGSAMATADGTTKSLFSNAIDVTAAQKLTLSAWASWAGLTYSGSPIQLNVAKYLDGSLVGYDPIASIAPSAGTHTWQESTGSYTVPSGVDRIRVKITVTSLATAGSVWFDDVSATKTGLIQQSWVTDLISDFTGIFGSFGGSGILSEFQNAGTNILALLGGPSLTGSPGALDVGDIWTTIINDVLNPLELLFGVGSSIPDGNVPGVGNILDNIWSGITGLLNSGRSQTDMQTAVASQTDAITNHAAVLSQVVAALSTGTPDSDDFERTSSTDLGSTLWDQYQTGSGAKLCTSDGHNAIFSINLLTAGEWVARRKTTFAATDNQVVEIVLNTIPATFAANGYNDLWLRMTTFSTFATRTGIRFRYTGDGSISLDWVGSGTVSNLFSGSASIKATAGATLRFEAGNGLTPRRFRALINGTPVMDFTESGTTSQYGVSSGYKYRGFGAKSESVLVNFLPGNLRQWTASG